MSYGSYVAMVPRSTDRALCGTKVLSATLNFLSGRGGELSLHFASPGFDSVVGGLVLLYFGFFIGY